MSEMFSDWQDVAALSVVAAACAYLVWRGWLVVRRRRGGCGACPTCPADEASDRPLVTIELTQPAKH